MAADEREDSLLPLLNSSGFPFQIGVRKEIERTISDHRWKVIAEEHPWRHPEGGGDGFIDLIIQNQLFIFSVLIECKRVKEVGKWLFLAPREYSSDTCRLSAFWTRMGGGRPDLFGWDDVDFDPISPESAYCTLHGQDEKRPMLERLADGLLPALEAVGLEEVKVKSRSDSAYPDIRLLLPVIVTNATLYTATFDAEKVSMDLGRLYPGDCDFKEVPCVRFRKGLQTHYERRPSTQIPVGAWDPLRFASQAKERTLFIVNSASLAKTLGQLRVPALREQQFEGRLSALAKLK